MKNKKLFLVIGIIILTLSLICSINWSPQGDVDLKGRYQILNGTNITGQNITGDYFIGDGSQLTNLPSSDSNSSEYWDSLNSPNSTQFENQNAVLHIVESWLTSRINGLLLWTSISGRPTHLSNFTDNLGNRGYTSVGNFTNDKGYYNSTTLPASSETLWSANYSQLNASWASTYNSTYNTWAYNQTTPAINHANALNVSFATWVDNLFPRFSELVGQIGNWTLDKPNYYTKTEVNTNISNANTSMKTYVDAQDNLQDECSEISGCVVGALTSESDPKAYNGTLMLASNWNATNTSYLEKAGGTMTGNIALNGNYLSGDGGNEGIYVNSTAGSVGIGSSYSPTADLSVTGDQWIVNSANPIKSYRFRTSGGALDFDGANSSMYFTIWQYPNFTGTQTNYIRQNLNSHLLEFLGNVTFRTGNSFGSGTIVLGVYESGLGIKGSILANSTINSTSDICIQGGKCLSDQEIDTNETTRVNALVNTDCGVGNLVIGVQSNGTVLCAEDQIGSPGAGDIESVQGDNIYVYNGSNSGDVKLEFNETKLNLTITSRSNTSGLIRDWNASGHIINWNATGYIKNWLPVITGFSYYNSTSWNNPFSYWNSTFATFNKTYADTLYYGITNPFGFYNSTNPPTETKWNANYSTFLTHITWATASNGTLMSQSTFNTNYSSLYLKTNPFAFWNSTFAVFNKTYADTLYSTIAEPKAYNGTLAYNSSLSGYSPVSEPKWTGNYSALNASWSSITNTSYLEKAGGIMTGNLNISNINITSSGSGKIYTNSTCIKLEGATSVLEIC